MDVEWSKIFPDRKKTASKFEALREPVALGPDFEENKAMVLEWVFRCGRRAFHEEDDRNLMIPMRDRWYMVDHEMFTGLYFHLCDPKRLLSNYTKYQFRWEMYLEHRKNPALHIMIHDAEGACRDALWACYNSTGKNEHFWSIDHFNALMPDVDPTDVKKMKANDTLEFHSCDKCQEAMPKPIVITNKLQRSKLAKLNEEGDLW